MLSFTQRFFVGLVLLTLASSAVSAERVPLFEAAGPRPDAVRQGNIGSCYFHASVAALANTQPDALRKLIQPVDEETFRVEFPDKTSETAYLADINFARQGGYDISSALWVGVLFRAYSQRVLRASLVDATGLARLSSLLPGQYGDSLLSNDLLLLAYDRAIRAVVDQSGIMSPERFERELTLQIDKSGFSPDTRETIMSLVRRTGVFEATSKMIGENGELFGAYRAVGQGGLPSRVLQAMTGERAVNLSLKDMSEDRLLRIVGGADSTPVVAATRYSFDYWREHGGLAPQDERWYVPRHAFTVLGCDRASRLVTIRNPWGGHPAPDGVFTIPLSKFVVLFEFLTTIEGP